MSVPISGLPLTTSVCATALVPIVQNGVTCSTYACLLGSGGGGGVTQITAGSGVTISPACGLGNVTICASGGGGGLTSVGLSMPSAFSVSNSPLTSNGSISVSGSGNSCQLIGGDGSLISAGTGITISGGTISTGGGGIAMINSGGCCSILGNGLCNSISTFSNYSFVGGGLCNTIPNNNSQFSVIAGGNTNSITTIGGGESFIGSGFGNDIQNPSLRSNIVGGTANCVAAITASIVGGFSNAINFGGGCAAIVGGEYNLNQGPNGFIGAGSSNRICWITTGTNICSGSIVGGNNNCIVESGISFIGGGFCNIITNSCNSSIVSGCRNNVCSNNSSIVSGCCNLASANNSFIAGGSGNTALCNYTGVFGCNLCNTQPCTFMANNFVAGDFSALGGCGCVIGVASNGKFCLQNPISASVTQICAGAGIVISPTCGTGIVTVCASATTGLTSVGLTMPNAFCVCGSPLTANGSLCVSACGTTSQLIGGDGALVSAGAGISIGSGVICSTGTGPMGFGQAGNCSIVGTGCNNFSCCNFAFTGGGCNNINCAQASFIGGGFNNITRGCYNNIIGGLSNNINSCNSIIGGGYLNYICGAACASISSFVGGGVANNTTNGVGWNCINNTFVLNPNPATAGRLSVVSGGIFNLASGNCSTISGGYKNTSSETLSLVVGGLLNNAGASYASIIGGSTNSASGYQSFIGNGFSNGVSSQRASVLNGRSNTVSSLYSTIIGGCGNTACCGNYSTILGGSGNIASGAYSGAFGCNLTASADCTFYVNNMCVCGTLFKTAGSFKIPHPDPIKAECGKFLKHSFVESPTAGDNIYRYNVTTSNCSASIDLPDYYNLLNGNDQVYVNAKSHLGYGFGIINSDQTKVDITTNTDGDYNVLIIGTRKDKLALDSWNGTEVQANEEKK
jgi:hypothetical protein